MPPSPASSEEIFRTYMPRADEGAQMLPQDGTVLEDVIGDLQSEWGVPQYPQEYRITVKIAEPKEPRGTPQAPRPQAASAGGPKREKAPAAPRMGAGDSGVEQPSKRRRRRRRRRKAEGGGESS